MLATVWFSMMKRSPVTFQPWRFELGSCGLMVATAKDGCASAAIGFTGVAVCGAWASAQDAARVIAAIANFHRRNCTWTSWTANRNTEGRYGWFGCATRI